MGRGNKTDVCINKYTRILNGDKYKIIYTSSEQYLWSKTG